MNGNLWLRWKAEMGIYDTDFDNVNVSRNADHHTNDFYFKSQRLLLLRSSIDRRDEFSSLHKNRIRAKKYIFSDVILIFSRETLIVQREMNPICGIFSIFFFFFY